MPDKSTDCTGLGHRRDAIRVALVASVQAIGTIRDTAIAVGGLPRQCAGSLAPFDALTSTSSHESCEAITDPAVVSGRDGEPIDACVPATGGGRSW